MKKLLTLFALLCIVLIVPTAASAASPTQVFINGSRINSDVDPQIINSRTFVPFRAIAEILGSKVSWNDQLRKVTVEKTGKFIEFTIGNPEVNVDGHLVTIEVAPYIAGGSSMLPIRFLAEQFGLEVDWDFTANSVLLNNSALSQITSLTSPIDHIVVVVEENHSYKQIVESANAPYIQTLIQRGALFTNAHGVTHPSQPNYLALFSGSTQGITDDSCKKPFQAPNLASELIRAKLTFTGYSEDLPRVGFTGCSSNGYARKHNPWVQFTNVPAELNRPFSDFPHDFASLPSVSFVIPNHQNDMHDGTIQQADNWLKSNLDAYVTWAQTHRSLLIVIWDEDDFAKDNHIPLIMVGPMVASGSYDVYVNHKNVLRTIEDALHLPILRDNQHIEPITSIWK